jgi:hypothetical protein
MGKERVHRSMAGVPTLPSGQKASSEALAIADFIIDDGKPLGMGLLGERA